MAEVIKKVNVPSSILTELDWDTGGHIIRYRIIADNKNIRSHWSPVYFIPGPEFSIVTGDVIESIGADGSTVVTAAWSDVFDIPAYDVYVSYFTDLENPIQYDGNDFFLHGTPQVHSYSFTLDPEINSYRIIVQPATNKKLIKEDFIVFTASVSHS